MLRDRVIPTVHLRDLVVKVPIGTVMSRLARARTRLMASFAAQEGVGKT